MVMMIDDDDDALEIYKMLIEHTPWASCFVTYNSAALALETLTRMDQQTRFPQYILLDLNMPGVGGIEFIQRFKEKFSEAYPNTTIIILTSSVKEEDHEKALAHPLVAKIMSKPLSKQLLIDIITASEA